MPTDIHPVQLDGGLVTSNDPALIPLNALQQAEGARYAPDDPRLRKAQGRTRFNATPLPDGGSIVATNFNSAADQIIAQSGTKLYRADVGTTGSFSTVSDQRELESDPAVDITLETTTNPLTAARLGDSWLIANGANSPIILQNNLRARKLSMRRPTGALGLTFPSAGTFPRPNDPPTVQAGIVDNPSNARDGDQTTYATMRTQYQTGITTAQVMFDWTGGTGVGRKLNVILSGGLSPESIDFFPTSMLSNLIFFRIQISTDAGANFTDIVKIFPSTKGRSTISSDIPDSLSLSDLRVRLILEQFSSGLAILDGPYSKIIAWMNVFDVLVVNDGTGAPFFTSNAGLRYAFTEARYFTYTPPNGGLDLSLFVESSLSQLAPDIATDALTFPPPGQNGVRVTRPTFVNSETTHWHLYRSTDAATNDGTKAIDQFSRIAIIDGSSTSFVDRFNEAGFPMDFQDPSLAPPIIEIGGILVNANDPAPASCDVVGAYQGSALYATADEPDRFWWSRPLQPDYVPSSYSDLTRGRVTAFVDIGTLLVFTTQNITVYPVLPLASDTEFVPGRQRREISSSRGCVSRRGWAVIDMPGRETIAAFVSGDGLWFTNGAQVWPVSRMIEWPTTVSVPSLSSSELFNDVTERKLILVYTDSAGIRKALDFYYDREQIVALGPRRWPSGGSTTIVRDSSTSIYTIQNGIVYLEKNGSVDDAMLENSDKRITFRVKTGQWYPFGLDNSGDFKRFFLYSSGLTGSTIDAIIEVRFDNGSTQTLTRTISLDTDGLKEVMVERFCESLNITLSSTSATPPISSIAIYSDQWERINTQRPSV